MKFRFLSVVALSALITTGATATPFDFIRIGDVDGFGFTSTAGLKAANGANADTNGNGILQQTEFLPSLNGNSTVATGSGDDFDNRSAAESAGTAPVSGNGFADNGSSGVDWTDFSLSTSAPDAWFPDGSANRPNEPVFIFNFSVAVGDIDPGTAQLFFNLVFGDYDVTSADIDLTFASAAGRTVGLTTQGGGQDGLIQAATTTLSFAEVFTFDALNNEYDGFLQVQFDAPNEPYTAFDFVELSLDEIEFNALPEPGMLAIMGLALAALGLSRRRTA